MAAGLTRLLLLALAGAFAALALAVHDPDEPGMPAPQWLQRWEQNYPDPRVLGPDEAATFTRMQDAERREDLLLLLAGLSVGCLAAGWSPRLVQRAGGAASAVLVAGSVAVGAWALGSSAVAQWNGARAGTWTLADDNLDLMAGPDAGTLRDWRVQIGEHDAVIVVGTDQALLNVVAWALYPRAIYPLVLDVPPGWSADELRDSARGAEVGRGHPRRWIVDLAALRAGGALRHPPLVRVDA